MKFGREIRINIESMTGFNFESMTRINFECVFGISFECVIDFNFECDIEISFAVSHNALLPPAVPLYLSLLCWKLCRYQNLKSRHLSSQGLSQFFQLCHLISFQGIRSSSPVASKFTYAGG